MTLQNIGIRPATLQDIDGMVRLLEQLFSIEKDFDFNADRHKKGLAMMLDGCGKHRSVQVAVEQGQIVGMCTIQTRISTASGKIAAVLEDLVIDQPSRGRGIGRKMLRHMEKWAADRGIRHIQLLADNKNQPALSFYKKNRWKTTRLVCLTRTL